jgi:hypothetical protein
LYPYKTVIMITELEYFINPDRFADAVAKYLGWVKP